MCVTEEYTEFYTVIEGDVELLPLLQIKESVFALSNAIDNSTYHASSLHCGNDNTSGLVPTQTKRTTPERHQATCTTEQIDVIHKEYTLEAKI